MLFFYGLNLSPKAKGYAQGPKRGYLVDLGFVPFQSVFQHNNLTQNSNTQENGS